MANEKLNKNNCTYKLCDESVHKMIEGVGLITRTAKGTVAVVSLAECGRDKHVVIKRAIRTTWSCPTFGVARQFLQVEMNHQCCRSQTGRSL